MADNAQKTPLVKSMNNFARAKALGQIQQQGKSLPASVVRVMGSIVQVKFEVQSGFTLPNVTVPLIGSEYARPPIQPGCKGLVIAADAYLGGMSGLGGGVADLTNRGNLTALVFSPIGNSGFSVVDGNAFVIYGPNGVVLRDSNSVVVFTLTPGGIAITGNITITGSLTATGSITAGQGGGDQVGVQTHTHVASGTGGNTGVPNPGT